MRRALLAALTVCLFVPTAASGGVEPAPARAALTVCSTGADAAERFAVFSATMLALPGSRSLAMRFDLHERRAGREGFASVQAPGLGRFRRSGPGRSGFVFTERVENLGAPAEYRAVVRFRWYDDEDDVVRRATRVTPVCRQPDVRPDLRLVRVALAAPGRYTAVVENGGGAASGATDAVLFVAGAEAARAPVPALPTGQRATVELLGPVCASGQRVGVTLDPSGLVAERDEANNARERGCAGL